MTSSDASPWPVITAAAAVLGSLALAARPPATMGAVVVTAVVGLIGVMGPLEPRMERHVRPMVRGAVLLSGAAAFAIVRVWVSPLATAASPLVVVSNLLAAVAEEAFFRRLVYGVLMRWGPAVAIGGSATAFAAVHVRAYGLVAIPIDLAAGLLFGWQRWATGGWSAPALTHIAANLLQMW